MHTGLPLVLGACLLSTAPAFAQPPLPPSTPGSPVFPDLKAPPPSIQTPPKTEAFVNPDAKPAAPDTFKFWVRAEYLGWWVKNTPLPVSLVTGDPNNPTQELLDSPRGLGAFSGFRVGLGVWIDPCNNVGLETNIFSLQRRTRNFFASSDDTGDPTL